MQKHAEENVEELDSQRETVRDGANTSSRINNFLLHHFHLTDKAAKQIASAKYLFYNLFVGICVCCVFVHVFCDSNIS